MRVATRLVLALIALAYCVWASATLVRHWAGTPDGSLTWLLAAPAAGCILTALGLAGEHEQTRRRGVVGIPSWREVFPVAAWLQWLGLALLSWRSLWMFFSWDGLLFFPAWLLLAAAVLLRWRPRWLPCT